MALQKVWLLVCVFQQRIIMSCFLIDARELTGAEDEDEDDADNE